MKMTSVAACWRASLLRSASVSSPSTLSSSSSRSAPPIFLTLTGHSSVRTLSLLPLHSSSPPSSLLSSVAGPRRRDPSHSISINENQQQRQYHDHYLQIHTKNQHFEQIQKTTPRWISSSPSIQKAAASAAPLPEEDVDVNNNSIPFLLADIGEGISEVELLQWFIQPGDTVSQFDRICQVQSDKASVEITSRFDGVIETLCGEVGDMMKVGQPLLFIATKNGSSSSGQGNNNGGAAGKNNAAGGSAGALKQAVTTAPPQKSTFLSNIDDVQDRLHVPTVATDYSSYYSQGEDGNSTMNASVKNNNDNTLQDDGINSKVLSSPAVRKIAKEHDINLSTIIGTGPHGRVLKVDVLNFLHAQEGSSLANAIPMTTTASSKTPQQDKEEESSSAASSTIPIRGYHRLMVKSMTQSLTVPHMVYTDEINVDALTSTRDALRPIAQQQFGIRKLTYLPFFVKAASLAMKEYPMVNSTVDVDNMNITYHKSHNIGVAVDTERGLAVPVVKDCQDKSVLEIAVELGRLFSLAMEGNLSEEDITNPTFTLSNIGAIGGTYMSPVVVPPQVAIGAMGKIQRLPRFINDDSDQVVATRIMPMSWGGDHRAIDGATMAKFSNLWKSYCENPSSMMFAMR